MLVKATSWIVSVTVSNLSGHVAQLQAPTDILSSSWIMTPRYFYFYSACQLIHNSYLIQYLKFAFDLCWYYHHSIGEVSPFDI